ncbi:hypothetical protein [Pantoea eucrina]|uniref:hypothetical protein n=1 Tax=Pantoea eucrina TaxID=472693 RepID=UPI00301CF7FD
MSNFKVGEVALVKETNERVRIVKIRETQIAISGRHVDYWCEYLDSGKPAKTFATSELLK